MSNSASILIFGLVAEISRLSQEELMTHGNSDSSHLPSQALLGPGYGHAPQRRNVGEAAPEKGGFRHVGRCQHFLLADEANMWHHACFTQLGVWKGNSIKIDSS